MGVNVSQESKEGYSPIHKAAELGNLDVMKVLIDSGAQINQCNHYGVTPLHRAINYGQDAALNYLLERGAAVNTHSSVNLMPPFLYAIDMGNQRMAEKLLEHNANLHEKSANGRSALFIVVEKLTTFWTMVSEVDLDEDRETTFKLIQDDNLTTIFRFLLLKGVSSVDKDNSVQSPLGKACEIGPEDSIWAENYMEPLLNNITKEELNFRDQHGRTPLCYAAIYNLKNAVHSLIAKGANLEIRDRKGFTPLTHAAVSDGLDSLKILLESGASLDCRCEDGRTILSNVVRFSGGNDCARLLVKEGVDVNAKDFTGEAALAFATIAPTKTIEAVELLLENGADIETKNDDGRTPLSLAAQWPDSGAVLTLLLDNGAMVDNKDRFGRTPLSHAAQCLQRPERYPLSTIQVLLNRGAEVDSRDEHGRTPLIHAVYNGTTENVSLLLCHGANPNIVDALGQSLEVYAQANGSKRIAYILETWMSQDTDVEDQN